MAEMHEKFASGGEVAAAQKQSEVDYILGKLERQRSAFQAEEFARIESTLRNKIVPGYVQSSLPATAYHGDANIGNFMVDGSNVRVIDVGSMKHSLDGNNRGKSTGAADVGRFMQSLEASAGGHMTGAEIKDVQDHFLAAYVAASKVPRGELGDAMTLFRAELEIAAIQFAKSAKEKQAAVVRLGALLGLSLNGSNGQE
jgi:Ser/Thr protein kinase RdoA (MazF antagonist)